MNEPWPGPSDLVPAPSPPSAPSPGQGQERALIQAAAASSAGLWAEVLERLDQLQTTQLQLVRAIGDLTGLLRQLAEPTHRLADPDTHHASTRPTSPGQTSPGQTSPGQTSPGGHRSEPRAVVLPALPTEPPAPPPPAGAPLGFRVRPEDLLEPVPERPSRPPRVLRGPEADRALAALVGSSAPPAPPAAGAATSLPPPPPLPPPPSDWPRSERAAAPRLPPPPAGAPLPPPPPAAASPPLDAPGQEAPGLSEPDQPTPPAGLRAPVAPAPGPLASGPGPAQSADEVPAAPAEPREAPEVRGEDFVVGIPRRRRWWSGTRHTPMAHTPMAEENPRSLPNPDG